jgi:peptidoglycan/LPS O-acetylase OafA/YrhL
MRWYYHLIGGDYERSMFELLAGGPQRIGFISWLLLFTWQPLLVLFALLAGLRWRQAPTVLRDLLAGAVLLVLLVALRQEGQGHGWGSRYMHPLLGCLALAGAWAWCSLRQQDGTAAWIDRIAAVGLAAMLPLLLLRAWTANELTLPFARAAAYLRGIDADVVLIETQDVWLAHDLTRNDPWLRKRPLLVWRELLQPGQAERLRTLGSCVVVDSEKLLQLGLRSKDEAASLKRTPR